ncbi:MAG: protein kinase [Planctomycetes bacterium]|nr:protein kinase [Planctomycetota bacterium]
MDPRDDALLAALIRRGWLAPERAEQLRRSFKGPPGGIGAALVQVGAVNGEQLKTAFYDLSRGSGLEPSWGGTTPPSAFFRGDSQPRPRQSSGAFSRAQTNSVPDSDPGGSAGSSGGSRAGARLSGAPEIPGLTILAELGRGGMGAVYRGRVDETGRIVAIKVLLSVSEARVKRFEREAQAMERLKHEHVIELVATGLDERGQPYLAMDYVTGGDLSELQAKGISLQQSLEVVAKVARAIDYAHGMGILHRDLKPANVLLDAAGEPRVTDFGLAKILDRETQLTRTNAILGTPFYMAPEQVRGEAMSEQTDVYALGVLLYELLTQEYPCGGGNRIELYQSIQHTRPTPPEELAPQTPKVVSELILWALEKDVNDRPTCEEFGDLLSDVAAGRSPRVLPPSLRNPGTRAAVRLAATLLGVILVLLAGYGVVVQQTRAAEEAAAVAAIDALREANREARRARGGREVAGLIEEVKAHRVLAELASELPAAAREQGAELSAASHKRRPAALRALIEALIKGGEAEQAGPFARELSPLLPEAEGQLLLVDVLSRHYASAAEAYAVITRVRVRGAVPAEARVLAEALLRLARPRQAAEVLAKSPAFAILRARAWRLSGEPARAAADLRGAKADPKDPLALVIERALVEGELGRPKEALARLTRVRGANDPRWHEALGALAEQLGQPGSALMAYAQASKLGGRGGRGAQLLLQQGYRKEALARLGATTPADRLDAALARWIGGGPDEPLRAVLEETIRAVEEFGVNPGLAAASATWLSLLEASRGPEGYSAALAAVERARKWAPPESLRGASVSLVRAWILARLERGEEALEALPSGSEAAAARAALQLEVGLGEVASPSLADQVPLGAAWRARRALLVAQEGGAKPARLAALSVEFRERLSLGGPRRPGAEAAPVSVPIASILKPGARQLLAARLVVEAGRLKVYLRHKDRHVATRAKIRLLLDRALGLAPHHVLARLEAIKLGGSGIGDLLKAYPYFDEVLRVRIRLVVAPIRHPAERKQALAELHEVFAALALSPKATVLDLLDCSRVARLVDDNQRAWDLLAGPLKDPHRTRRVYQDALSLARELERPELEALKAALEEIADSYRNYKELYAKADVGEADALDTEAPLFLKRIHRDLPLGQHYYNLLAQTEFGEGAWALGNLTGGRYLAVTTGMHTGGLSMWLYAFGWSKEAPQNLVFDLGAAEAAKDRLDPAPHLGRALYLASRATLARENADPDDVWRGLRYVRLALELKPDCYGALCLAYFLTVTGGLEAEAASYLQRGLALAPNNAFLRFHEGRAAALRGDWQRTLELYRDLTLATSSRRLIKQAPSFEAIRGRKEWADFVAKMQKDPVKKPELEDPNEDR